MSKLINAKIGAKIPIVDSRLNKNIYFTSTMQLDDKLIKLFEKCFCVVADQLEFEHLLGPKLPYATCIALDSNRFTLEIDEDQLGIILPLIIYPIHKWNNVQDKIICVFIIEELCHCLWGIRDEIDVNYKVHEVMKRIYPEVKLEDLYDIEWMNAELAKRKS